MPLLDHFRPPITQRVPWESFHSGWGYEMARSLNRTLIPAGYLAEPFVTIGTRLDVDVATFDRDGEQVHDNPSTAMTMDALFPDDIEVQVFRTEGGSRLVAAIELVSPRNKDRPEARRGFAAKCAAYLQRGIGVVIVDLVTTRQQNLHDQLVDLLGQPAPRYPTDSLMYAVAYRPSGRGGVGQIEIWPFDLTMGQTLPAKVPLALRNGPTIPVDLETTYQETCQSLGL